MPHFKAISTKLNKKKNRFNNKANSFIFHPLHHTMYLLFPN